MVPANSNNSIFRVYSNVDSIIKEYKGRISDSVLEAAKTLTEGLRDEIQNTYSFTDENLLDNYVTMRFNPGHNLAHVRVIGKQFSALRMQHVAPAPTQPGYTDIRYKGGKWAKIKGFPLKFEKGGIMSTRSKTTPLESWQHAQSKMPFTHDTEFAEVMDYSKETIFETEVTIKPGSNKFYSKHADGDLVKRKHSFRIVKTKNIVEIAEKKAPELINSLSKDVSVEITRPRTEFWKMKKRSKRKGR